MPIVTLPKATAPDLWQHDAVKVTVITVAWNAVATIGDTCASVAAQDWPDIEHIIIDGASTDGTAAVVKATALNGHIFISEPDEGLYDAMNKGIAMATGDLVGFLNADDFYCRTDAIRLLANAALLAPAADAVSAAAAHVGATEPWRLTRAYPPVPYAPWMLRFAHMPSHLGFYARRTAFGQVGNFDPSIRTGADFEWMVRFFAVHGLTALPVPQTIVNVREGGLSNSGFGSRLRINAEALASLRRHGLLALAPLVWAKYLVKSLQYILPARDWPPPRAQRCGPGE
jgi:glycosyltransferase involved in cell wall biosynthesis